MARKQRPALTSPWKIGFFVSLLLVVVGIGVGYLITRSFGVTWSWIEFHGTWTDFTFNLDAFMTEMLPLAVLVSVVALVSHLVVTGAVRKYRQSLDSGMDYKRLIQSLKKVEDIGDEKAIRKLTSHPELRTLLLTLHAGMAKRHQTMDEGEATPGESAGDGFATETLCADADTLIGAIASGTDFPGHLSLELPDLKRVEAAIRDHLIKSAAGPADDSLAEMRADLERSAAALRTRLEEIHEELNQSERDARELETEFSSLRSKTGTAAPATTGGTDAAAQALSRLDSIGQVLASLGEETRSVAIKTALQASSAEASVESVVTLADEVRDVAAKFNGVAAEWDEASRNARQSLATLGDGGASARTVESLESLSNKVGRWTERAVILTEKVKTFEQHFADAMAGAIGVEPAAPAAPQSDGAAWDIEQTNTGPAISDDPVIDAREEVDEPATAPADEADTTDDDTRRIDVAGFEKQEGLFSEIAGAEQPADAADGYDTASDSGMFTDIPETTEAAKLVDTTTVELDDSTAGVDEDDETPNRPTEYVIDEDPADTSMDDIITGPGARGGDAPEGEMPPVELDVAPAAPVEAPVQDDAPDEAIDLYALGAEDYAPENVHHNA